jgi:mannan endo-1,4-beta-mannosidase
LPCGNTDSWTFTEEEILVITPKVDGYFTCASLDVLVIHAYGVGDYETSKLQTYVDIAKNAGKKLIMQ